MVSLVLSLQQLHLLAGGRSEVVLAKTRSFCSLEYGGLAPHHVWLCQRRFRLSLPWNLLYASNCKGYIYSIEAATTSALGAAERASVGAQGVAFSIGDSWPFPPEIDVSAILFISLYMNKVHPFGRAGGRGPLSTPEGACFHLPKGN